MQATPFILVRAITYATLFIAMLLVFVPRGIIAGAGVMPSPILGPIGLAGLALAVLGTLLAFWCIASFVTIGKGTPAPFDPPRRLVVAGPYRYVRNPMYLGAGVALAGAALLYRSSGLFVYAAVFLIAMHTFVVLYEEPTLRDSFGDEYAAYTSCVRRWLPHW